MAKRIVKRFLKKSTFTDEQGEKFVDLLETYLATKEGTAAVNESKPKELINKFTDWIAEQPDYDDQFWRASRPKKKRGWLR